MPDRTKIEWADATWNPIVGCSKISPGCANCYAERMARRLARIPNTRDIYFPLLDDRDRWNGATILNKNVLIQPFRWRKPRRIFVGSMTDLFYESTPDAWLDPVFDTMHANDHHTFLVLTKRPHRMRDYVLGQFNIGKWPHMEKTTRLPPS